MAQVEAPSSSPAAPSTVLPGPGRSAGALRAVGSSADLVQMESFMNSPSASVSGAPGPPGSVAGAPGPARLPGPARSAGPAGLSPGPARAAGLPRSPAVHGPGRSSAVEAGALLWITCEKNVWRAGLVLGHNNELVNNCWKRRAIVEVQGDQGKEHKIIDVDAAPTRGGPSYLLRSGELLSMQGAKTIKDLSLLPSLAEPEILHALRMRYAGQNIYTFAGPMLLAVNPFEEVSGLYDSDQLHKFANLPHGCPCPTPHVFGIAREAFLSVQHSSMSQTVLVSGESGAGKTESAKFVIRFLALAGGRQPKAAEVSMEHRVLESVPLLEALGNARTTKNDNSSRFGKYIELQFQHEPDVLGPCIIDAVTHTYLLETVRVTELNEGERCFHIFYQILAAAARAKRMMLAERVAVGGQRALAAIPEGAVNTHCVQLTSVLPSLALPDHCEWSPHKFAFLARSSYEWRMPWADEAKQFDGTVGAMRAFNMTDDEISQVISAIVAVLHLGNIKFQSLPDNSEASKVEDSSDFSSLALASELLGVNSEDLSTALCTRVLQVYGKSAQVIRRRRTLSQAADCRDALARHLYGLVFAYIVARINGALSGRGSSNSTPLPTIGVLDIFGFEVFEKNCFEQLCINFANEILQQHFNTVIIDHELALYRAEGIQCDLHEGMVQTAIAQQRIHDSGLCPGIFPMLDDECSVAGGTAESWLNKVAKKYSHTRAFQLVPQRKGNFVLHHFAGPVEYSAKAFLAKNRDTLSAEAMECMQGSSKTVLRQQFNAHGRTFGTTVSMSGRVLRAKAHSVSSDFQVQLDRLMKNIQATRPHFIRCMKPNQLGAANLFDSFSILQQLRYQGVLETIRVARAGYGFRLCHEQSVLTYQMLAPRSCRPLLNELVKRSLHTEAARVLFTQLKRAIPEIPSTGIQVGKSMTFFRAEATDVLGIHVRRRREAAALHIQVSWQGRKCAQHFAATRKAALRLQRVQRGRRARNTYQRCRKAAMSLQTWRRANSQRSHFQVVVKAVICLQRWFGKRLSVKKRMSFALTEAAPQNLMASNRSCTSNLSTSDDNCAPFSNATSETSHELAIKDIDGSEQTLETDSEGFSPPLSRKITEVSLPKASDNCQAPPSCKLEQCKDASADADHDLGVSVKTAFTVSCYDDDLSSTSSSRYPSSSVLPCSASNFPFHEDCCSSSHQSNSILQSSSSAGGLHDDQVVGKLGEQFSALERLVHEVREEVHQVCADNLEKEVILSCLSQEQERASLQLKSMDAAVNAAKAQAEVQQALLREEQHALQASIQLQHSTMEAKATNPSRNPVTAMASHCESSKSRFQSACAYLAELQQLEKQKSEATTQQLSARSAVSTASPKDLPERCLTPRGHQKTANFSSDGMRKPPGAESLKALHSEIANSVEAALSIFALGPSRTAGQNREQQQEQQQVQLARSMATALSALNSDGSEVGNRTAPSTPQSRSRSLRQGAAGPTRTAPSTPMGQTRSIAPGTPQSTTRTMLRMSQALSPPPTPRSSFRKMFTPASTPAGGSVNVAAAPDDASQVSLTEMPPSVVFSGRGQSPGMPMTPRTSLRSKSPPTSNLIRAVPQGVASSSGAAASAKPSCATTVTATPQPHNTQTLATHPNSSDGKPAVSFVRQHWSQEPVGASTIAPKVLTRPGAAVVVRRSLPQGMLNPNGTLPPVPPVPPTHARHTISCPQPSVLLSPRLLAQVETPVDIGSNASRKGAPESQSLV